MSLREVLYPARIPSLNRTHGVFSRQALTQLLNLPTRVQVSVVIAFHGREQDLIRCLDSLERQTFHSFEVIVVADGVSVSDDLGKNLRASGRPVKFHRIRSQSGAYSARRTGAAKAAGEYIWFLDHDDTADPNFISELLTVARQTASDIVECPIVKISASGERIIERKYDREGTLHGPQILDAFYRGHTSTNLANKLIRKSVWQSAASTIGTLDGMTISYCDDLLCAAFVHSYANTYHSHDGSYYNYFWRADSTMNTVDQQRVRQSLISLGNVMSQLEKLLIAENSRPDSVCDFLDRQFAWLLDYMIDRADKPLDPELRAVNDTLRAKYLDRVEGQLADHIRLYKKLTSHFQSGSLICSTSRELRPIQENAGRRLSSNVAVFDRVKWRNCQQRSCLVYLDPDLNAGKAHLGHHWTAFSEIRKIGIENRRATIFYGSRSSLESAQDIYPVFATGNYLSESEISEWLNDPSIVRSQYRELYIPRGSTVLLHTSSPWHIDGLVSLLKRREDINCAVGLLLPLSFWTKDPRTLQKLSEVMGSLLSYLRDSHQFLYSETGSYRIGSSYINTATLIPPISSKTQNHIERLRKRKPKRVPRSLRFGYFGQPKNTKGFDRIWEAILTGVADESCRIEFFLPEDYQYFADPINSKPWCSAVLQKRGIKSYYSAIASVDVVLCFYDPEVYSDQMSGIVADALSVGKPVLVSKGSSLERFCESVSPGAAVATEYTLDGLRQGLRLPQSVWHTAEDLAKRSAAIVSLMRCGERYENIIRGSNLNDW